MKKVTNLLRVEELEKLASLVVNDQDLQNRLNILKDSLIEYEKLEDLKNLYDVSFDWCDDELVIFDNVNKKEYLISKDFLDDSSYLYENGIECDILIDIEDEIEEIENLISGQGFTEDKNLMSLNLRELYRLDEKKITFSFVDNNVFGVGRYISKDNPEKFNLVCQEFINAYEKYKKEKIA